MEQQKQLLFPVCTTFIALILIVSAILAPWWTLKTATEVQIALNATARADYYGISPVVYATVTIGNNTQTVFLPIENLTQSEGDRTSLASTYTTTSILIGAGLTLTVGSLALLLTSLFRRISYKIIVLSMTISAVLLIVATGHFAINANQFITKLSTIIPVDIPTTWVPVSPPSITSFWGFKKIPTPSTFPVWVQGGNFWVWGAALGWFAALTAGLILLASVWMIRSLPLRNK